LIVIKVSEAKHLGNVRVPESKSGGYLEHDLVQVLRPQLEPELLQDNLEGGENKPY
jgi:hypothetical protein